MALGDANKVGPSDGSTGADSERSKCDQVSEMKAQTNQLDVARSARSTDRSRRKPVYSISRMTQMARVSRVKMGYV